MPFYDYQIIHEDGTEGEVVELMHKMSDPTLTEHPETGEKLVRVFQAPHLAGSSHERIQKQNTTDEKLNKIGFTKYVRNGKGHYEKRAGQGPDNISAG